MDHLSLAHRAAAGAADSFAAAKGAYRFFNNERVDLPALGRPLQLAAEEYAAKHAPPVMLVVHDWSAVKYPGHNSKRDQIKLSNKDDFGYELLTALAVDGGNGDPVAPLQLQLRAADGVHSTREPAPARDSFWLDELSTTMKAAAGLKLGETVVHIIDREGDSVAHYREWDAAGRLFLVRADDERLVLHEGEECKLPELGAALEAAESFAPAGEASRQGKSCAMEIAETAVVLHRPGWRHRTVGGKRKQRINGPPLPLRLIVVRLRDETDSIEATWLLLTNVQSTFDAATVARWYYYRWRVESLFKLLKSAGMELEHWQQETGSRIARRLLVACMTCVVVWRLNRAATPDDCMLRDAAMKLSGRLAKKSKPYTAEALLVGVWRLLGALLLLETYSPDEILQLGTNLADLLPRSITERLNSS